MSDSEHFAVHKSADSLSVHKARMARPRFAQDTQAEDEEDDLDLQDDQPDSPAPDTEVQARVDSIALAQKRLNAKSSDKSRFESNKAPKSRFGQVKLPEEVQEPASDEKKIKVASGTASLPPNSPGTLGLGSCAFGMSAQMLRCCQNTGHCALFTAYSHNMLFLLTLQAWPL